MKLIRTEDAVGHVLCHDITQIIKGVTKDAVFRKGHVIREEDIPVLLSVGKDHIYIWENDENMLHENEAAEVLRDICINEHMRPTQPKEGKIELIAERDGLYLVDTKKLYAINSLGNMMIATRPAGIPGKAGDKLCGTRIIPLVIEKTAMEEAKRVAGSEPIMQLVPIKAKKYGVVPPGNEVFHGRIQDTFTPVLEAKLAEYDRKIRELERRAESSVSQKETISQKRDTLSGLIEKFGKNPRMMEKSFGEFLETNETKKEVDENYQRLMRRQPKTSDTEEIDIGSYFNIKILKAYPKGITANLNMSYCFTAK